jgi:ribosomal protein L40E
MMQFINVKDCPHKRTTRDSDPDYRYCIDCFHTVYMGARPLGIPPAASDKRRLNKTCIDCNKEIQDVATRCRSCASKAQGLAMRGDSRLKQRNGQRIAIAPRLFEEVG